MTIYRCKATNKSGEHCKLKATSSGYCHIHDPQRIAERDEKLKAQEQAKKIKWEKGNELREVLNVIYRTCNAKGWESYESNLDEENWRYATVSVERSVSVGYTDENITGIFEITVDKGVKVSLNSTSFHKYGLRELYDSIMAELYRLSWLKTPEKNNQYSSEHAIISLERIHKRFHIVTRLLKNRHSNRETIVIEDEYDVQDLLHALLRTVFDDIRPEEYAPSYAGSASRVDFLLKAEQIVVEAKMASKTLRDKQVGEQLIIDIKRYQSHPDCKYLVCFVYDPDNWIKNPIALESDLTGKHDKIHVKIFVAPH